MTTENDVRTIVDTAMAATLPRTIVDGRLATIVVPEGASVHEIELEDYAEAPSAKRGHVGLSTPQSFSRYVVDQRGDGTSIWADVDARRVTAVLDDHHRNGEPLFLAAGWGAHRATLQLRHTPEWQRWAANDRKWLNQVAFAEHLQDGLPDIARPPAALMLELAQTFSAKRKVDFGSSQRLKDGQTQLTYKETVEARAGAGNIEIPEKFALRIAPFVGYAAIEIEAWLRYRIDEGRLSLCYQLDQAEQALRTVFAEIVELIASETEIRPYDGSPRS